MTKCETRKQLSYSRLGTGISQENGGSNLPLVWQSLISNSLLSIKIQDSLFPIKPQFEQWHRQLIVQEMVRDTPLKDMYDQQCKTNKWHLPLRHLKLYLR